MGHRPPWRKIQVPFRLRSTCALSPLEIRLRSQESDSTRFRISFTDLRVGLSAVSRITCPTKNLNTPSFPAAILRHVVRALRDHRARDFLDRARVADLRESFGRDDFRGALAGLEHLREHFFPARGGDFAAFALLRAVRQASAGTHGAIGDVLARVVQPAQQFDRNPVRRRFCGSARLHDGLEIIRQLARRSQHARVVRSDAVVRAGSALSFAVRQFRHVARALRLNRRSDTATGSRSGSGK